MKYEEELRQVLFDGVKMTDHQKNGLNKEWEKEAVKEKEWRDGEEKHQQKINNGVLQDEIPLEREYESPYPY